MLDHTSDLCEKMSLVVEGKETELFDFLAALESTTKQSITRAGMEAVGEVRERIVHHGGEH